jgi:ketopantoate reductase
MMQLSDNMGPYQTSTMLDLTNRRPMEVKYLFRKAVERANKLGVEVPTLETIVTFIEALQRFYKL